jgi:16S rRNA processing protein RimM
MNIDDDCAILLAAITSAHGLDGSVKLKIFSDDTAGFKRYKIFTTDRGVALTVKTLRQQADFIIARFNEIADRTAAEQWRGAKLYINRADLPAPHADEIYHIDLVGMTVMTPDGATVGKVIDVPNYGAGDLLDIQCADSKTILVPYRDIAVLNVDTSARRIIIDPVFLD